MNALTSLQTVYFYRTKMTGGARRILNWDRIKLARNMERIKRTDGMQNAAL